MKRFGRNQKRRMREQVAQLQQGMAMDRALLADQRSRLDGLREEIRAAKRIAGAHAVLFSPERVHWEIEARQVVRRPVVGSVPRGFIGDPMKETFETVDLDVMLADAQITDWERRVHLQVTFRDSRVGYAITRQALEGIPKDELVRMLTREMAPMLAQQIAKLP